MNEIINIANALVVYTLLLIATLIAFKGAKNTTRLTSLIFIFCVLSYVIIEYLPQSPLKLFLLFGPFMLPFTFWLLARSLFSDQSLVWIRIISFASVTLIAYYMLFFINRYEWLGAQDFASVLSRAISIAFVVLAIIEAQKGKSSDLIERRRKIRTIFTYVISAFVLLTLLAELGLSNDHQGIPKLLQRSSILIFNSYFLMTNVLLDNTFLGQHKTSIQERDNPLLDKIRNAIDNNKLYRKEGLTIRQLAEEIEEQEYKVRQAINQQLGYRNFTEFVNSFRLKEAKELLQDPNKRSVTVLEIAYKIGFNSIGPFNRAFKNATGKTPTDYRNSFLE